MKLLTILIITLISIQLVSAASSSDWKIELNSKIIGNEFIATGSYIAGTKQESSDNIDIYDARMIQLPSYSIPFSSVIEYENFMADYKQSLNLNQEKTWQITEKGSSEFRRLGTFNQEITWNLDIPSGLEITLIDYGQDSTRTNIINQIDLQQSSSYVFEVNNPYNDYRYLDLKVKLIQIYQEPNPTSNPPQNNDNNNDDDNYDGEDQSGESHTTQNIIVLGQKTKKDTINLNKDDTIRLNSPKKQGFFQRLKKFFKNFFRF